MKLLHVADLHIGKRVNGYLMIEEQLNAIEQIVRIAKEEGVAGVLVAGDVFDRPNPSREALAACERLFSGLCEAGIPVFAIPGNHDSAQQLAFCSMLLSSAGLHIAKAFDGAISRHVLEEGGQRVVIHLLPFVRPTDVRMALPQQAGDISSHDDAVRVALAQDVFEPDARHVLVAHQFVTSSGAEPQTCDSELLSVGGADNVDASAFDAYDYVALGHLHGAQHVGRPEVRYSGSPLKYSFSEVGHDKSVTLIDIGEDGIGIETRSIVPLHDMREVLASYEELLAGVDEGSKFDYLRVILTDKSLPDAMAKLRALYPNVLRLDWELHPDQASPAMRKQVEAGTASPFELFSEYYLDQTGEALDEDDARVIEACIEEARS